MELIKPRYELINARCRKGWTEVELAERIKPKPNVETVRRWEAGIRTPQPHFIEQLCDLFGAKHPKELNLDAQFNASTQGREEKIAVYRREFFEYLKATAVIAGVEPVVLLSATVDDPKELLHACRVALDDCWVKYHQNNKTLADNTITALMPGLRELAMKPSSHQHNAALLVVEAKILQVKIATQKEDYERRVLLGSDMVLIGEMSGDRNLHAASLGWYSNTYVNCYFQPETAIAHLKNALPYLNENAPLNQTDIYMELARAYALDPKDTDKEATKVRDYIELAHRAMPDNPEADPLYRLIDLGNAEFGMREGKTYLILARRFPTQKEYAQKAHNIFATATNENFLTVVNRGGTLIYQADAARAIGDMQDYLDSLTEGVQIALQIGSDRQISRAVTILQKAPRKWRNEQRYIELRKILTPNSGIARK